MLNALSETGRWPRSHHEYNIMRGRPAKPDPDVVRLQEHYLLTYPRARILKALSFGLPIEYGLMLEIYGPTMRDCHTALGNEFASIRDRIPHFSVEAAGHSRRIYVMRDDRLRFEIKRVMYED